MVASKSTVILPLKFVNRSHTFDASTQEIDPMHIDRREIARAANDFARIYRRQPRNWDMVQFRPRREPLPPKPWREYLKAGWRQAWANHREGVE